MPNNITTAIITTISEPNARGTRTHSSRRTKHAQDQSHDDRNENGRSEIEKEKYQEGEYADGRFRLQALTTLGGTGRLGMLRRRIANGDIRLPRLGH
jgi:hypothetical protein